MLTILTVFILTFLNLWFQPENSRFEVRDCSPRRCWHAQWLPCCKNTSGWRPWYQERLVLKFPNISKYFQPKSKNWPQDAFLGPLRDSWTLCSGGISLPTSSNTSASLSSVRILFAIWNRCVCARASSGVGFSSRLFGISLHSVSVGKWYLTRLSN